MNSSKVIVPHPHNESIHHHEPIDTWYQGYTIYRVCEPTHQKTWDHLLTTTTTIIQRSHSLTMDPFTMRINNNSIDSPTPPPSTIRPRYRWKPNGTI